MQPIELDAARISTRFEQPGVRSALQDVGVASSAALLATWVTDRAGLQRFAADAPADAFVDGEMIASTREMLFSALRV